MNNNFPFTFDYSYYNSTYSLNMSPEKAYLHFMHIGKNEGFLGSKYASRQYFLNYLYALNCKSILEIGPGAKPCFSGKNVKYFDYQDESELVKWAERYRIENANIPKKIHYVSKQCDITIIPEKFDLVFSSHNIEHQVSIIDHLQNVSNLLNENGIFALIIPDKRYCFDHFKPITTIIDVISTYYSSNKNKHPLKAYLENAMLNTHNNPVEHWKGNHILHAKSIDLKLISEQYINNENYVDVHAHCFTPETFEEITLGLYCNGFFDLEPIRVFNTPKNVFEFCAILKKRESNAKYDT